MVVLVDLSDTISDPHADADLTSSFPRALQKPVHSSLAEQQLASTETVHEDGRPNLNLNGFSAALSCYPIVSQLASLLDLNSLHNLSRTCRQFRVNLLQFRDQLVTQSLRCSKEDLQRGEALAARLRESRMIWRTSGPEAREWQGHRITSGKVGKCARDMVGECRRCGTIVCRNCTAKPPPVPALSGRHRRLCKTCLSIPLTLHTSQNPPSLKYAPEPDCSARSTPTPSPSRLYRVPTPQSTPKAFAADAFLRTPCDCPNEVWLCQSCGHNLRNADTTYARGWAWRTRYTTYLGGLGTGIGEGNEGVQCGRRSSCFAAKTVEHEVERDAHASDPSDSESSTASGRTWSGGGFEVQEINGVGGLKKKVKKMVRVGRWVEEYEDERDGLSAEGRIRVLEREIEGRNRSWCAWCERVIPSKEDLIEEGMLDGV